MREKPKNHKFVNILSQFASLLLLSACQNHPDWEATLKNAEEANLKHDSRTAIKYYNLTVKQMDDVQADPRKELPVIDHLLKLLLKDKEISEADKLAKRALSMAERVYGPSSVEVLSELITLRSIASEIPDKELMAKYLERMIEIQEKLSGADSSQVMWLLAEYTRNVSIACGEKYDPERLRRLVKMSDKYLGVAAPQTLRYKRILADYLIQNKSENDGFKIYDACLLSAKEKARGLLPEIEMYYAGNLLESETDKTENRKKALNILQEAFRLAGPGPTFNPILAPKIADLLGDALIASNDKRSAEKVYLSIAQQYKSNNNDLMASQYQEKVSDLRAASK